MSKHYRDDFSNEDFVDINSSATHGSANRYASDVKHSGSGAVGNKKPVIIISSVAAAVVVALGITGFCLFGTSGETSVKTAATTAATTGEYTYPSGTVVSGVSIGGQTYEEAKKTLEANTSSFITPITITIDVNGSSDTVTQDDFEYTYDIEDVLTKIKNTSSSTSSGTASSAYEITASVTEESVESAAEAVAERNNKEATNAKVSEFSPYADERFTYEDAVQGLKVDSDDLANQFKAVFTSGKSEYSITAEVSTVDAEITLDDVKNNIVKLATYSTVSTNTANGTENMRVSLAACNGSIIEPGDTWSFNECTGNSNLESLGYKSATVISDGEYTSGIGGGICQSSSTIYNAALRANMEVVERQPHKWASSYVPTGLDATIDYGNIDLKLKNTSDYQMFLECKVDGSTLYATFWGYKSDSYDYISTENEMGEQGSSSYSASAWRVYYKDGEVVDREELPSSSYDSSHGITFISAENDSGVLYDGSGEDTSVSSSDDSSSQNGISQTSYTTTEYSYSYNTGGDSDTASESSASAQSDSITEVSVESSPQADDGGTGNGSQ